MARPRGPKAYYRCARPSSDALALLDAAGLDARARRRPRLGRHRRVGARRVAPRPGAHADRGVGPPPRGDAEGLRHQRPGAALVLHGPVPAAAPPRAASCSPRRAPAAPHAPARWAARRRGRPLRRSACASRARSPAALGWYRALPWSCARPGRHDPRVPTLHVWSTGDAFLGRDRDRGDGAVLSHAPYRLEVLDDVLALDPELAPDRVAELVTAHVRSAESPRRPPEVRQQRRPALVVAGRARRRRACPGAPSRSA